MTKPRKHSWPFSRNRKSVRSLRASAIRSSEFHGDAAASLAAGSLDARTRDDRHPDASGSGDPTRLVARPVETRVEGGDCHDRLLAAGPASNLLGFYVLIALGPDGPG